MNDDLKSVIKILLWILALAAVTVIVGIGSALIHNSFFRY